MSVWRSRMREGKQFHIFGLEVLKAREPNDRPRPTKKVGYGKGGERGDTL